MNECDFEIRVIQGILIKSNFIIYLNLSKINEHATDLHKTVIKTTAQQ